MTTTERWRTSWAVRILAWSWLASSCLPLSAEDTPIHSAKRIGSDPKTGISQAVIVDGGTLAYTAQFLPVTPNGELLGNDAESQTLAVLDHLDAALKLLESDLSRVVKLNVAVTSAEVATAVRATLAKRFSAASQPAVSFVQSRLPHSEALVAIDAVGVARHRAGSGFGRFHVSHLPGQRPFAQVTSIGNAPRLYISGQAEKGMTLGEATTKTLASLKKTLDHLGLAHDYVAQAKCFLTPMSDVKEAQEAIAKAFGNASPPCVFVEWQSSLPIEIELIVPDLRTAKQIYDAEVAGQKLPPRDPLDFITPPGMTASPVFCRVVRVNDPRTIFVSGLYAKDATDGAGQVTQVFEQLQDILKASGSDLRHLAKATYYVSDNDTSAKLNELRPKFYDPQRPPAASKAQVFGVGVAGRSLTLDMIAVPAK
ncbi:MAG: RidA family protein [Planctomycetaceae bacterium]|nr:RidA family protein [Planctomycetaceae bacterium]